MHLWRRTPAVQNRAGSVGQGYDPSDICRASAGAEDVRSSVCVHRRDIVGGLETPNGMHALSRARGSGIGVSVKVLTVVGLQRELTVLRCIFAKHPVLPCS
jgi:hypothetical protein